MQNFTFFSRQIIIFLNNVAMLVIGSTIYLIILANICKYTFI